MSKSAILPTYHPISHNSFADVSDHYLKTKKFRILGVTFGIFLFSLWIVAKFSGAEFNIHALRHHNKNNEAAMAAASVLGEGGEEGIHGLEVENHGRIGPNGHNHGIHEPINLYFDSHKDHYHQQQNFALSDSQQQPNIARQRFEEALKNDLHLDDYYYDSEPQSKVELEIDDLVHENPVVVFSKSFCPYSRRVKHILSLYRISPSVLIIEVDKRDDSDEFKQALIKSTYRNTFPNVFIDGRSIGGSDELALLHTNGRLSEILVEAGVLDIQNHEISRPAL
ncbi:thioredoxin-like protein [Glomus cerebriforme]|uniref:Thioredoxin-like protein n=1 Tax=Glomus cerebriforme TaxID=658196 RepID=A0A397T7A3_9GLOM|nr:thioredoxin-like protein [Glomus cerebriforme]